MGNLHFDKERDFAFGKGYIISVRSVVAYSVVEYSYHSNTGIIVKGGAMIEIYEKLESGKINLDTSRN